MVTFLRRFGSSWIGSIGMFKSWGSPSLDSFHAVQLASEVLLISKYFGSDISVALDYGGIVGGFLGNINYDLFGQEVRFE